MSNAVTKYGTHQILVRLAQSVKIIDPGVWRVPGAVSRNERKPQGSAVLLVAPYRWPCSVHRWREASAPRERTGGSGTEPVENAPAS